MIKVIEGRNVNDIYIEGLHWLKVGGIEEPSRNGKVLVSHCPVMSIYSRPWERVLFDHRRNANPFFHLAEAIWMLAGSNDAAWISRFNTRMITFSDDGGYTIRGAYGYRWRMLEHDQIAAVIAMLKKDPTTRRAVISMWDPRMDLNRDSKDVPCNTTIYFRTFAETLEMTVCCRSNDMVWGAYGANAVHFSVLHEFISRATGIPQGRMYQFSNNFHIYEHHWELMSHTYVKTDAYATFPDLLRVIPLFTGEAEAYPFLMDCEDYVNNSLRRIKTPFMEQLAIPMLNAYLARHEAPNEDTEAKLAALPECDWKLAALNWIRR